jgi:hypothetical protein
LKHCGGAIGCITDSEGVWNAGVKWAAGLKAERNENRFSGWTVKHNGNEQHKRQFFHGSAFLGL